MHVLRMGNGALALPERLRDAPVLARDEPPPLADPHAELRRVLATPLTGPSLEALVAGKKRITVVVPDATRPLPSSLVETLLDALGDRIFSVRVANGTHRRATAQEQQAVLGRHFSNVPHGDRHADDPFAHRALSNGHKLDVQAAACEALILIGPVSFHYLAGFGGGGKLLAPGCADRGTAEWIHSACLAPGGGRHPLARPGILDGNPLQARIAEVCQAAPPQLYIQPVLDSLGQVIALFAGEREAAHRAACEALLAHYTVKLRPAKVVVVSAGGHPFDVDFVQAHKALEAAASACAPGGTIVFVAKCKEGLPARHREFLEKHPTARQMEEALRQRFDIAAHTVWAAREKAERHRILAVTELDEKLVRALGMEPAASLDAALSGLDLAEALVMPFGARFLPA